MDQNGDGLMDGVLQNTLDPQNRNAQGYFLFQGTSMAAPHVAAVAALLVSQGVTDPEEVRQYLTSTATKVRGGTSEQYGAGIVNASEALQSAFLKRKISLSAAAVVVMVLLIAWLNRGRSSNERVRFNALALLGLLLGGTGLFFLGFIPAARSSFVLSHSVFEWPLHFRAMAFANPLVLSAVPSFLVLLALFSWRRMTPFVVAFCVAASVYLAGQALFPTVDILWIPGRLLESTWLLLNAALSLLFSVTASFRMK